jgi:hypothetical protein
VHPSLPPPLVPGAADATPGARLVYMLTAIAKVLELAEIERRLTRLEERSRGSLLALPEPEAQSVTMSSD